MCVGLVPCCVGGRGLAVVGILDAWPLWFVQGGGSDVEARAPSIP